MKLLLGEITTLNNWQIDNIALIDNYSYPQEEEEKQMSRKKRLIYSKD